MNKFKFATDENFHGAILSGLKAAFPQLDVVRIQDIEIYKSRDEIVLEWCARNQRILLTHDVRTIPAIVYQRINKGLLCSRRFHDSFANPNQHGFR